MLRREARRIPRVLGAVTLMWSLDGVLRYLPVSALQGEDGKYLVETYRNVIFTPASRDRLKDPVAGRWLGLGLGVSEAQDVTLPGTNRRLTFGALRGVRQELSWIIRDKASARPASDSEGLLEGRVLLDRDFTKDSLRAALRRKYPLVHIASHFMFQPGNENDSFLLLGGADEQDKRLTIAELRRLSFEGVELLTLSACETVVGGEKANGVEVESFGVLAQERGAEAVIATLWRVADDTTPLLMREFYRLRETRPGMAKVEALKQAQLSLLRGRPSAQLDDAARPALERGIGNKSGAPALAAGGIAPYAHPYFWAPFILMGNWR